MKVDAGRRVRVEQRVLVSEPLGLGLPGPLSERSETVTPIPRLDQPWALFGCGYTSTVASRKGA